MADDDEIVPRRMRVLGEALQPVLEGLRRRIASPEPAQLPQGADAHTQVELLTEQFQQARRYIECVTCQAAARAKQRVGVFAQPGDLIVVGNMKISLDTQKCFVNKQLEPCLKVRQIARQLIDLTDEYPSDDGKDEKQCQDNRERSIETLHTQSL